MYDGGESGHCKPGVEDEADEHAESEKCRRSRVRVAKHSDVAAAWLPSLPSKSELYNQTVERHHQ